MHHRSKQPPRRYIDALIHLHRRLGDGITGTKEAPVCRIEQACQFDIFPLRATNKVKQQDHKTWRSQGALLAQGTLITLLERRDENAGI